jgi:heme-degrading monooxygenase HmoA
MCPDGRPETGGEPMRVLKHRFDYGVAFDAREAQFDLSLFNRTCEVVAMIMRVYRCKAIAGKEAELREFGFTNGHPWLRMQPGLLAFYAGKPMPDDDDRTRCLVQIWESVAALQAAFGNEWQKPRKLPDETRLFLESATVEHYDIADEFHSIS